ncbi:hypothetical protein TNCV_649851 [Trichonephila clavipes]|nr:hypothetical protein TNCV_649851 [Trichonephila clavipes]
MGTTNQHRTWGRKTRLVGVIRKISYEECYVEWKEKGLWNPNILRYATDNTNNASQLDITNVTTRDSHRNCSKLRPRGHSTADTERQRIGVRFQTNPMCW